MLCTVCNKNEAVQDITFGVLPCKECAEKRRKNSLPHPVEMVGEHVKKEREDYAKSIIQPFNSAGEFSSEYYDAYGTKGIKVTPNQIAKRKRIWDKTISLNTDIKKTK